LLKRRLLSAIALSVTLETNLGRAETCLWVLNRREFQNGKSNNQMKYSRSAESTSVIFCMVFI
jgi:hypothetical protein